MGRHFAHIDREEEFVIPLQYSQAVYFHQGWALVTKRRAAH